MIDPSKNSFEAAGQQSSEGLVRQLFLMLTHHKKYWLVPLVAVLLIFGLLVILGGSAAAPFIYTLF